MKSKILKITAFICLFLNILGAGLTFISPETLEKSAKEYIAYQIEEEIKQYSDSFIENDHYSDELEFLKGKYEDQANEIATLLKNNMQEKIAEAIADICKYDCIGKENIESLITLSWESENTHLNTATENITEIIQGKYYEILNKLIRDLRIFLFGNIGIFLIILVTNFFLKSRDKALIVPSFLLILSTIICSYFYVFQQNWLYTILFDHYLGYGYLIYDAILFSFLLDIFFNKARVSLKVLDSIGNLGRIFPQC